MVSGILWNVAFGKQGNNIYAPIEFEGKRNIINQLERNGLLIEIPYIKGLIFVTYDNFKERKYIGFYRSNDFESQVFSFLLEFCDFVNDENNSMAFKILQQP